MRTKLTAVVLSVLLIFSFSGCTKTDATNTRAKEWGYFYFPNTDWGMTEDELFTAMKKEKSDFIYDERGDNKHPNPGYVTECSVFGDKINVRFDFTTTLVNDTPHLSGVQLIYDSDFTAEKSKDLMTKLDTLFEEQGAAVGAWEANEPESDGEGSTMLYQVKSSALMTDLPQEIYNAYNKSVRKLYQSGEYNLPDNEDIESTDFVKVANRNLSSASVFIDGERNSGFVQLGASPVVEVAEYIAN